MVLCGLTCSLNGVLKTFWVHEAAQAAAIDAWWTQQCGCRYHNAEVCTSQLNSSCAPIASQA